MFASNLNCCLSSDIIDKLNTKRYIATKTAEYTIRIIYETDPLDTIDAIKTIFSECCPTDTFRYYYLFIGFGSEKKSCYFIDNVSNNVILRNYKADVEYGEAFYLTMRDKFIMKSLYFMSENTLVRSNKKFWYILSIGSIQTLEKNEYTNSFIEMTFDGYEKKVLTAQLEIEKDLKNIIEKLPGPFSFIQLLFWASGFVFSFYIDSNRKKLNFEGFIANQEKIEEKEFQKSLLIRELGIWYGYKI